eukprot:scaffold18498_cov186-Amphora_coffeaeformis.AAC.8
MNRNSKRTSYRLYAGMGGKYEMITNNAIPQDRQSKDVAIAVAVAVAVLLWEKYSFFIYHDSFRGRVFQELRSVYNARLEFCMEVSERWGVPLFHDTLEIPI